VTITLEIPDSAGAVLAASGQDPSRALLEAFALEGYRADRLSEYEVQQLLGFEYFEQITSSRSVGSLRNTAFTCAIPWRMPSTTSPRLGATRR
jgi:hypothetical protein